MNEERATAALDGAGIDYTLVRHGPVSSLVEAAGQDSQLRCARESLAPGVWVRGSRRGPSRDPR